MKTHRTNRLAIFLLGLFLVLPSRSFAWTEEEFFALDKIVARFFVLPKGAYDLDARTVIGTPNAYTMKRKDTLLDVARYFDLGFNEIAGAHPDIDPWLPISNDEISTEISLPTWWVLPKSANEGVVVNIPEMRLYYFPPLERQLTNRSVITLPVGLGREDWPTPTAKFKVMGKTVNPTWVIPESIKQERIKEKGWSEDFIAGGSPDNPMGKYRIELTLPMYRIHDTNNPWAVGRLVTHGCIRMYPEDIARFFDIVRVGSPGEFVYQPIKIGVLYGKVYAEVHDDIYKLIPDLWEEALRVVRESGYEDMVDQTLLIKALMQKTGVPVDVTKEEHSRLGGEIASADDTEEASNGTESSYQ
ncbi:MAG: L,D-transpeptidase family protein [Deltaproteobacteria bacterium]|nr:L,D-transpeptidase family protein [Deltaproteobacteria bacterium]